MDLTSGYPLWPVQDGLIRNYPRLDDDRRCDVVVLGAGITGALVAYHLADAGFDVTVLDKRDVGWGSTAGSTALLQYEIDTLLVDLAEIVGDDRANRAYLACRDAIGKLERLARKVGGGVGFERKKSLYLARQKRDTKTLRREHERRRAIGIDVDFLDARDVSARFAFDRPGALLSRDGAQVDAFAFCHALLRAAEKNGARIFDKTMVDEIDARDDEALVRTISGCTVRAKHLVFASGYETRDFLKPKVAKLVSTFAIATEPLPDIPGWKEDRCLIWEHAQPYLYLRTTIDGRIIIGGEDEPFRDPEHRDRLLAKKTRTLLDRFHELFPDIAIDLAFSWAGTFGETKDGLAYIGTHPDWPSAHFVLGYGGNGITYSVLGAEIVRDSLLGKRNANAELFRFDR